MAGIKELKDRIKSVSDTQKITNAMYLVACAKYSSTHDEMAKFSDYYKVLEKETVSVLSGMDYNGSIYTSSSRKGAKLCFAVGSDKGMAGDYNKAVFKEIQKLYKKCPEIQIYVIGEKIKKLLENESIPFNTDFICSFKKPDDTTAQLLSDTFIKMYDNEEVSEITAVYTESTTGSSHKVISKIILPIIGDKSNDTLCEYIPSKAVIADSIIPIYFKGVIRNILLQSYCSEQSARMTAMKAANDNAKDLISELTLEYNHTRQNAITAEITEISGERKRNDR